MSDTPRRSGPVWVSSGLHLARPSGDGRVVPTPDLMRAWLMRVELRPIPESGAAERALHESLVDDPMRAVAADEVAAIEDEDGRENYRLFLRFRQHLTESGTVEDAYRLLAAPGDGLRPPPMLPPLFIEQMAHLIVANLFETRLGGASPLHARAAEILFREQVATVEDGSLIVADAETVEAHEGSEGAALFRTLAESGTGRRGVELDVLHEGSDEYWARADRYDTALDMRIGQPAQDAFAEVLAAWTTHMTGAPVRVEPVPDIADSSWRWHIGLDREASVLLDRLWNGEALDEPDARRIAGLYRLDFEDQALMREEVRGRPVHLAMAMDAGRRIRLKPQNLVANLPLAGPLANHVREASDDGREDSHA